MLPTAVALLGQTYPPGRKRNLAFGLFGGFNNCGSILWFDQLLCRRFECGRRLGVRSHARSTGESAVDLVVQVCRSLPQLISRLNLAIGIPCIPVAVGVGLGGDVDWVGAFLGVAGLILFNFSFK